MRCYRLPCCHSQLCCHRHQNPYQCETRISSNVIEENTMPDFFRGNKDLAHLQRWKSVLTSAQPLPTSWSFWASSQLITHPKDIETSVNDLTKWPRKAFTIVDAPVSCLEAKVHSNLSEICRDLECGCIFLISNPWFHGHEEILWSVQKFWRRAIQSAPHYWRSAAIGETRRGLDCPYGPLDVEPCIWLRRTDYVVWRWRKTGWPRNRRQNDFSTDLCINLNVSSFSINSTRSPPFGDRCPRMRLDVTFSLPPMADEFHWIDLRSTNWPNRKSSTFFK